MINIAFVGCGKIADAHITQIKRIPNCRVVAACDIEPLMAKQFCERFEVKRQYNDLSRMLFECQPDVVHITTPPQTHFIIGKTCLEKGCHVLIEKPFTVNYQQAIDLIDIAIKARRKVAVGTDRQFSHAMQLGRKLIKNGYIGKKPLHMESYYSFDLNDPRYAKSFIADKNSWMRRLPGKLLHDTISHGIARIAEYLETDDPYVYAFGFVSPTLKEMGEKEIIDELRVVIIDKDKTTAYFTFSSQMQPCVNQFRIFGPKNGLLIDEEDQTVIKLRGSLYKSFAQKFIPPITYAKQYLDNFNRNIWLFLRNDFHLKSGIKPLIEGFYHSITDDGPLPISAKEILVTVRIMDKIFDQLGNI